MVYSGKSYWDGWFGGTPILGKLHILSCPAFPCHCSSTNFPRLGWRPSCQLSNISCWISDPDSDIYKLLPTSVSCGQTKHTHTQIDIYILFGVCGCVWVCGCVGVCVWVWVCVCGCGWVCVGVWGCVGVCLESGLGLQWEYEVVKRFFVLLKERQWIEEHTTRINEMIVVENWRHSACWWGMMLVRRLKLWPWNGVLQV